MHVVVIQPPGPELRELFDAAADLSKLSHGLPEATVYDLAYSIGQALTPRPSYAQLFEELHAGPTAPNALVFDLGEVEDAELGPSPTAISEPRDIGNMHLHTATRAILLGVAGQHGFGMPTQQHGRIANDVAPLPGHEETSQYSSAPGTLGYHTEESFYATGDRLASGLYRAGIASHWLTLHFLRNSGAVPTNIAARPVNGHDSQTEAQLRIPQYRIKSSISHGPTSIVTQGPIIAEDKDGLLTRAHLALTETAGLSPDALQAYETFASNLESSKIPGKPGTVAFINNRTTLHGRDAVNRGFATDGTGRWQQRVNTRPDLPELGHYSSGPRQLDPQKFLSLNRSVLVPDSKQVA